MKNILLLLIILSFTACSGAKSQEDVAVDDTGIELSDSTEFEDEFVEQADDFVSDEIVNDSNVENTPSPIVVNSSGEEATHTVTKNETLMMVAYKIYGDYAKWREIAAYNNLTSYNLTQGQVLKYISPATPFEWNPQGNPYLIKRNDTLGKISDFTYGTTTKWKAIWDNNRPLIKDPNKIFVGFTIYTPTLDSQEVASR